VEGNINYKDRLVSGILSSIVLGWKLPYISTHNIYETAEVITALFTKYGASKTKMYPPKAVIKEDTPERIRWAMLQCVRTIGPKTAKRILEVVPIYQLGSTNPVWLAKQVKSLRLKTSKKLIGVFQ